MPSPHCRVCPVCASCWRGFHSLPRAIAFPFLETAWQSPPSDGSLHPRGRKITCQGSAEDARHGAVGLTGLVRLAVLLEAARALGPSAVQA
jgi:hypothetical protein